MSRATVMILFVAAAGFSWPRAASAAEPADLSATQREMVRHLDSLQPELVACNQAIWDFAELGLQEYRSSARLIGLLKQAGFRVREGVSGMPTAFAAEYGSG